ncbi:hypothetical protein [Leptospira jelokensis]|uniref:Uncharacterized protein n=1 Tax=Leptospira jelokensis TaxID=2484931 RepID=A0A4Z1ACQ7_9LEPT|nr:hypothetical protein [Leptospira jelokensis]TGL76900.1 hypothetical protein EHQ62_00410 [Leptospira jelokensis]
MNFEEFKKEAFSNFIGKGTMKIILSSKSQVNGKFIINDFELIEQFLDKNRFIIEKCDRIDIGYAKNEEELSHIKNYNNYFIMDNGNTFTKIK